MAVITTREKAKAERLESLVKDLRVKQRRPETGLHSLHLEYKGDNSNGVNLWEVEEVTTYGGSTKPLIGKSHFDKGVNGNHAAKWLRERIANTLWKHSPQFHCTFCEAEELKRQAGVN